MIHAALPHYRTDAILRRVNLDRYDDRDDIRVNLLDSYERLMQFVSKHLNDNFYLEGDRRTSLRDKIFRFVSKNVASKTGIAKALGYKPITVNIKKRRLKK